MNWMAQQLQALHMHGTQVAADSAGADEANSSMKRRRRTLPVTDCQATCHPKGV
jgi:hypothetical protein